MAVQLQQCDNPTLKRYFANVANNVAKYGALLIDSQHIKEAGMAEDNQIITMTMMVLQNWLVMYLQSTRFVRMSCYLTTIPSETLCLPNLTSLCLVDNNISVIPSAIGRLTNLTSLAMANNRIEYIPREVCALSLLECIDMSNNRLRCIPPSIVQLKHLMFLHVTNNTDLCIPGLMHRGYFITHDPTVRVGVPTRDDRTSLSDHYSRKAREAAYQVMLIWTHRRDSIFSIVPREIAELLAKHVWDTRNEPEWWINRPEPINE